jgi:hypothetical protein
VSVIADIATAVVEALNAGEFSQEFTAVRHYLPTFDLKDMKDLHVSVVPKGVEMSLAGRGLPQDDVQIDVAVQKKLTAADLAEIDALVALVQEIADFVRTTGKFGDSAWMKTENVPIYSPEHLEQLRQFTSVLTLTLRMVRPWA